MRVLSTHGGKEEFIYGQVLKLLIFFWGGNIKLLFGYIYFWNMIFQPILEVNIVVLLKILEIDIMLCFFVGNMIFSFTCFTQRLVVALVHRNLYLRRVNVVLIESIHRKITTSER